MLQCPVNAVCDIERVSWCVFSLDRTQPEPLFAEEEDEEEEVDKDQPEWKKRKIWRESRNYDGVASIWILPQTFQTFNWTVDISSVHLSGRICHFAKRHF